MEAAAIATIVGRVAGRMVDPIGWIVFVGMFFALRSAGLPTWARFTVAALGGACVVQILLLVLFAKAGQQPDFLLSLSMWVLTGLVECGIAWVIAKGFAR